MADGTSGREAAARWLLYAVVAIFVGIDALLAITLFGAQLPGIDWAPLWGGTRLALADPALVYDFAAVTDAQTVVTGAAGTLRPFIYPPSALLILAPFAALPFGLSYAVWTIATGGFYAIASRRIGADLRLLTMPVVILVALVGQTSFLIGGLIVWGLSILRARPLLAGLLLGVATAIRPQTLLLLPIALLIARNWGALLSWGLTGTALAMLSAAIFGIDLWHDWLQALAPFQELFRDSAPLMADAITPFAVAERADGAGWLAAAIGAVVAIAILLRVFRRAEDVPAQLIALVGGALLVTPYAMHYDLALLAPAIAALPMKRPIAPALILLFGVGFLFGLGLVCVLGALAMVAIMPASRPLSPGAGTAS